MSSINLNLDDLIKDELPEGTIDSSDGILLRLLNVFNNELDKQYNLNRIRGNDYANVYLSAYPAIQNAAIEIFLNKDIKEKEIELAQKRIELLEEQIAGQKYDNIVKIRQATLIEEQIKSEQYNNKTNGILDKQLAIMDEDISIKQKQVIKIDKDTESVEVQTQVAEQDVILKGKQSILLDKDTIIKTRQANKISKDIEALDTQISITDQDLRMKEQQYDQSKDKHVYNLAMLANQKGMTDIDLQYKPKNALVDLQIKSNQADQVVADTEFTESKKTIMEDTRKDNVRMKSAEQFAEFMKYVSAANVVPAEEDFDNMRKLIINIAKGVINPNTGVNSYIEFDGTPISNTETLTKPETYINDLNV